MIIGITGHRPSKLGGYDNKTNRSQSIKAGFLQYFTDNKPEWIVSGMALGVDQWAVEVALDLNIKVIALIPCVGQEKLWPKASQDHYINLLSKINTKHGKVVQLSDEPYRKELMHARNGEIINLSDVLLAVWDGSSGGTGNCVWQAKKSNKKIVVLHPYTLEIKGYEYMD